MNKGLLKKCIFIGLVVFLESSNIVYADISISSNMIENNVAEEKQVKLVDIIGDDSGQSDLSPTYVYEIDEPVYTESVTVAAALNNEYGKSYASDYVYDHLSETEKKMYDRLQIICEGYLNMTQDAVRVTYNDATYYYTGLLDISDLELEYNRAYYVALMFRYNNGQYYFLEPTIWRSKSNSGGSSLCRTIGLGIYDEYADGEQRQEVTQQFLQKVEEYQKATVGEDTLLAKEKVIHDKLCSEITYGQNDYDQSAVSALLMGETVCAGYSQAFEVICNSIGMETVGVTSSTHEWNKILIDGHWYNVDVTWGDEDPNISYDFFNKSDKYYAEYNTYSDASHTPWEWWYGVIPDCNYDMDIDGVITPNYDEYKIITGWVVGADGKLRYYNDNGNMVTNQFAFDGTYTYYLQADGTPMTDRLTYHPDGVHIIYFDKNGHEVFNSFQYCSSVGYVCYFDCQGYIYKDQITFHNNQAYYLDQDGRMKQSGWFQFANGDDWGYAERDGTLRTYGFGHDPWGRMVFYHWNGMVARGLITDGVWYYSMDMTDGHYLGRFIL